MIQLTKHRRRVAGNLYRRFPYLKHSIGSHDPKAMRAVNPQGRKPAMRRTIALLASMTLAAAMSGGTAAASEAGAVATLDLYAEHNQTGDVEHVQPPANEECVQVLDVISSLSAHNNSTRFIAGLYINGDCTGAAVEVVYPRGTLNFSHRHRVESIMFVDN
ncbi:hypothetical protein [Streptosporangium sp. NPDC051022]|uniref:hypothetical protein n=1 Tax=Streptosporangium sp. NPDC051022 TaxID=3155752 RepID=UPI00343A3AEC